MTGFGSSSPSRDGKTPIPARAGIGVKPLHYRDLLHSRPPLAFIEVHAENYMGAGGPPHAYLEALASEYRLSLHGVGMNLAGIERPDPEHLARWSELIRRYQPALISEHIAWSGFSGFALHDLLPVPYTGEALQVVCDNIDEMQNALQRRILVENPTTYVSLRHSEIPEADFMAEVARRTGCGLLLDINNVYVSAFNHGADADQWLTRIPAELVCEIHLAGHALILDGTLQVRIDDHGSRVRPEVWALYDQWTLTRGPCPTLIEWDTDVPSLDILLTEARIADRIISASERAHVAIA